MGLDIACVCWSCLAGSWNKPWIFDFGSGKSNLAVNSHELSEELCDFIVGSAVTRHVLRFEFADPDHLHRDPVTAFEWSPWPCPLGHWVTGLWEGNSQTRYTTCLRGMVWRDIECTPRFLAISALDAFDCERCSPCYQLQNKRPISRIHWTNSIILHISKACARSSAATVKTRYIMLPKIQDRRTSLNKQCVDPWKQGVGSSTEINATGKCDKKRYEKMTVCKNPWHGFLQDTQTRLGIVTARQLEITWKNIRQNGGAIPLIHLLSFARAGFQKILIVALL